jgi:hypothetical protein
MSRSQLARDPAATPSAPPALPRPLRVAAAVLGVQGGGLVFAGVAELIAALAGHPTDRPTALFLGGLTVLYGALVVTVARGLAGGRTWAGTPAFMVEFFAVIVGIGQLHTLLVVAVPLLVTAAVAFAALLHPDSRAVLVRQR